MAALEIPRILEQGWFCSYLPAPVYLSGQTEGLPCTPFLPVPQGPVLFSFRTRTEKRAFSCFSSKGEAVGREGPGSGAEELSHSG